METIELKNLQNALLKEREERKLLERNFNKQHAEFNAIFQNLADAYLMIDLTGKVLKMNGKAKEMLGYDINKEAFNLMQTTLPSDFAKISESYKKLVNEGVITSFRLFIKTKDNIIKYASVNASVIYDDDKKPIAAQGIVRDITESHKKEQDLIKSEKRLETLILDKNNAVLLEDENSIILSTNKKFCELFKIPLEPELLRGQDCSNSAEQSKHLFVEEEEFVKKIKLISENRKPVYGDELVMKDGTILERDFVPIFIDGIYNGHLWTYRDITLKKRYDKNIQAEKYKYQSIINNTNLGLVEIDGFDTIKTINKRLLKMYGKTEEEVLGHRVRDLFPNKNVIKLLKELQTRVKEGKSESLEFDFETGNSGKRFWLISVSPNYNMYGEVIGYIVGHLDITHLKRLESQKDKLLNELGKSNEELQDYAHMVSHDLKAPLRKIDTLVSWFKEDYKNSLDAQGVEALDLIRGTVEGMENLIKGILVYSSLNYDNTELYFIDLNKLVEEISSMLHIPDRATVNIVNELPTIKGDKYRFLQLFQNLIHNAIKYNDKAEIKVNISCENFGKYWKFCVEDNGNGIKEEYLKRIFEVFQKLDNKHDSSGIGLSIVRKIVDAYEGEVYAESELGIGTKIFFTLKKF